MGQFDPYVVSVLADKIEAKFQWPTTFPGHVNQMELFLIIFFCQTGSGYYIMTNLGVKLPPGVSRVLEQIETKFRRLPPCFRAPAMQWNLQEYCATKPEVENRS